MDGDRAHRRSRCLRGGELRRETAQRRGPHEAEAEEGGSRRVPGRQREELQADLDRHQRRQEGRGVAVRGGCLRASGQIRG
ncbi:hypothetical protein LINPERPRIM_LOCUS10310 [Linum perenne]